MDERKDEPTLRKGASKIKEGLGSLTSAIKERVNDEIEHHRKERAAQKVIDEKINMLAKKAFDRERERQAVRAAEQRARDQYKPKRSYGEKFRAHVGSGLSAANPFEQPFLFGAQVTPRKIPIGRRKGKKGKKGKQQYKTTYDARLDPFGGLFGGL